MNAVVDNKQGFTILEVLIASVIFSVGILAMMSLAMFIMKGTEFGKRQTQAVNLAKEKMEMLKAVPYASIHESNTLATPEDTILRDCLDASPVYTCETNPDTVIVDDMTFTWNWTVTLIDLDGDGIFVEAATNIVDTGNIKRIDVSVSWTDLYGLHNTTLSALRKL